MESVIISSFNLLILIAILFFKLKKPSKDFVYNRFETIRNDVMSTRDKLNFAHKRLSELTAKLSTIESEILAMRKEHKNDIEQFQQKVISEANRLSKVFLSDAKLTIETMVQDTKAQLVSELGTKIIGHTEEILHKKLSAQNSKNIQEEFSQQLVRGAL